MRNPLNSVISYVVVTLLLSGSVLANPNNVSENEQLHVKQGSRINADGYYLALNRYPVAIPPISTKRLYTETAPYKEGANEAYLAGLQQRLRDELNFIIDSYELD